ncbi:hypothetical protein [Maricaulis sp.]|uniref:hypothetical protein n=1 Tax=Maricaulis sp. TaxID=1486257 RepID=UPI003A9352F0
MSDLRLTGVTPGVSDWFAKLQTQTREATGTAIESSKPAPAGDSAPAAPVASGGRLERSDKTAPLPSADENALVSEFLKWAHMSPAERIRAQYLGEEGLTEEALKALPKEERDAVELEIAARIQEAIGGTGEVGQTVSSAATQQANAAYQQTSRLLAETMTLSG